MRKLSIALLVIAAGAADRSRAATIEYSTYLGGAAGDFGGAIAVDRGGDVIVVGSTNSVDFPVRLALQPTIGGRDDAYVARYRSDGALLWATFLGGSESDYGSCVAIDVDGSIVVLGQTESADFPLAGAAAGRDAFVARLSADGTTLIAVALYGGSDSEWPRAMAIDSGGAIVIAGATSSTDLPLVNPLQTALSGMTDAFVARLTSDLSNLVHATYLGGSDAEWTVGLALDPTSGDAIATGFTRSAAYPTASPLQAAFGGGSSDAFVTRITADGSRFVYSTFLGGSADDEAGGIVVDGDGKVHLVGETRSLDFPLQRPLQASLAGQRDGFVATIAADGSALEYATFLGGADDDFGTAIALDGGGGVTVLLDTRSVDLDTVDPVQAAHGGGDWDTWIGRLDPTGRALVFASYLGGDGADDPFAVAHDSGALYVHGDNNSVDFPTVMAEQPANAGFDDGYLTKILCASSGQAPGEVGNSLLLYRASVNRLAMSWTAVPDTHLYLIDRKLVKSEPFLDLQQTTGISGTSLQMPPEPLIFYRVRASNACGSGP